MEKTIKFKKAVLDAVKVHGEFVSHEHYNTNYAWGFGGGIGVATIFKDGFRMRDGTAYFRHLPPEKYTNYYNADGKQISKKEFVA